MQIQFTLIILCCAIAIAIFCPQLSFRFVRFFQSVMRKLSHHVASGILFFAVLTLVFEIVFALCVYFPYPMIHDEFAYLLTADTFASGRLTNPTHPMWEHFESFHIIQQPSYQAKYPPGQGLFLAMGQFLFGYPIVGAWLSMAAAAGAIFWMLCGWVPRRWAVYGGFLVALNSAFLIEWGESFWGGQVALLGGALMFGAYPRLKKKLQTSTSIVLAIGLVILANSRPYEGLLAAIPIAVALLYWLVSQNKSGWSVTIYRMVLPILLVLIPAFIWMGYYNYRVTGNALTLPYKVWIDQYYTMSMDGILFDMKQESASQQPPRIISVYVTDGDQPGTKVELQFKPSNKKLTTKLLRFSLVYAGSSALILVCFMGVCSLFRNRENLFLCMVCALIIASAVFQGTQGHPHYVAPVGSVFILLQIQCLRYVYQWKRNWRPVGRMLVAVILFLIAFKTMFIATNYYKVNPAFTFHRWAGEKQQILKKLSGSEKKHLILVKYDRDHNMVKEWVYNESDLDNSNVVWARMLEPEKNQKLRDYYKDRLIWMIEADKPGSKLMLYQAIN